MDIITMGYKVTPKIADLYNFYKELYEGKENAIMEETLNQLAEKHCIERPDLKIFLQNFDEKQLDSDEKEIIEDFYKIFYENMLQDSELSKKLFAEKIRSYESSLDDIKKNLDSLINKDQNEKLRCVRIYFSNNDQDREIILPATKEIELPSERAEKRIRELIDEKKRSLEQSVYLKDFPVISILGFHVPYEQRSINDLEKNLLNIKETYKKHDLYEFFELNSHKLNIIILNDGDQYIEDAAFQIDIDKVEGLFIPKKIFEKPKDPFDYGYGIPDLAFGRYPEIEDNGSYIRIQNSSCLGRFGKWDIKHKIPVEAFLEPVRILLFNNLVGQVIPLKCKLYGKNLREPIEEILKIKVVSNTEK